MNRAVVFSSMLIIGVASCGESRSPSSGASCTTVPATTGTPAAGTYAAPLAVVLEASADTVIYYTTDGSAPSTSSANDAGRVELTLTESATVRFFGVACGRSEEPRELLYTLDGTAPTSSVDIAGRAFNAAFDVVLSASETATLYYTLDGTAPTPASDHGDAPLTLTIPAGADTVLSFFAVDTVGNAEATPHVETYRFDDIAPALGATPPPGLLNAPTTVTIAASEPAVLFYTTDGSLPTEAAAQANDSVDIEVSAAKTLRAFARDPAGNVSEVVSFAYTYDSVAPELVAQAPLADATAVPAFANVELRFSEPMQRAAIEAALTMAEVVGGNDGAATPLSFHWYSANGGDVLVAFPAPSTGGDVPWLPLATYHVTLAAAAAKDIAGNSLAGGVDFSFTTRDDTAPVVTLYPAPDTLASQGITEVSATFDLAMDKTRGRVTLTTDLFGDTVVGYSVDDVATPLAWNIAGKKITFTGAPPRDAGVDYVVARFSDLYKANGDKVDDVVLPILFDRAGADTTLPVLDYPSWSGGAPVTLDRRFPLLWFSKLVDPATLDAITVAAKSSGAPVDVKPHLAILGRGAWLDLSALVPGATYVITIADTLRDTAGNAFAGPATLEVTVDDPSALDPPVLVGLAGSVSDFPMTDWQLWLDAPAGLAAYPMEARELRLAEATTGAPVRGLRLVSRPSVFPTSYVAVEPAAGTPPLAPASTYLLSVVSATSPAAYAPLAASLTTAASAADTWPIVVRGESEVILKRGAGGPSLSASVLVEDDSASVSVSIERFAGALAVPLAPDATQPGAFVLGDVAIADPGFVDGWNVLDLVIDDGVHQVVTPVAVYFTPNDEIPTVTVPPSGASYTLANFPASFTWTQTPTAQSRLLLLLAELTNGGGMTLLGFTVVPEDATSFDTARFVDRLQPGKTYFAAVMKQVWGEGGVEAGEGFVWGRSGVTFSIEDPALGSIEGRVDLRAAVGAAPTMLLFDQAPAQGVDPIAAVAAQPVTGLPLSYTYRFANLAGGTYYVLAWVDVLGNDASDPATQTDNLMAFYGAPTALVVNLAGTKDYSGRNVTVDNWPGSISVDVTVTGQALGDVTLAYCTQAATNPPFDGANCHGFAAGMTGQSSATVSIPYVAPDTYTVWGLVDADGNGQPEYGLVTAASPASVTVASDAAPTAVAIVVYAGKISGTISAATALDPSASVFVVVMHLGEVPGTNSPVAVQAATDAGDHKTYTYTASYLADGDYHVYAFVDTNGGGPPELASPDNPVAVTVAGNTKTADFSLP